MHKEDTAKYLKKRDEVGIFQLAFLGLTQNRVLIFDILKVCYVYNILMIISLLCIIYKRVIASVALKHCKQDII